ncbi:hypothetical protein Tco_0080301 [Tanacetum coccineum]
MFFWVDRYVWFLELRLLYAGVIEPRDRASTPPSYSVEEAELINRTVFPTTAYSGGLLMPHGIARNYFQGPKEVPTFICEDGRGGACPSSPSFIDGFVHIGTHTTVRSVPSVTVEPPMAMTQQALALADDADVAEVGFWTEEDPHVRPPRLLAKEEPRPPCPPIIPSAPVTIIATQSPPQTDPKAFDKEFEILLLKAQLVDAQAEHKSYEGLIATQAPGVLRIKLHCLSRVEQEARADARNTGERSCSHMVPGYNQKAYEELVAAMEAMKLLELPHIAQLERDQDYPIGVIMTGPRDILNPFALEKEVPLKESLEGPRHNDGEEGDSELLGKLEEAGDAAYQVGRPEQSLVTASRLFFLV